MSALRRALADYLRLRRALGYKLERAGRLLDDFVTFAERDGADTITVELALRWATLPQGAHPVWMSLRLGMARGFARYLHSLDPRTEVPPPDLLPARYPRVAPYLYSDADIAALMGAARSLASPLRSATFECLIGLLAATGLRVGEAMRLDRDDVDVVEGLLCVRNTKFGKSREVPVHASTVEALRSYAGRRDRLCRKPTSAAFLVSAAGTRLGHSAVQPGFRDLLRRAGLDPVADVRRPRLHGLRHSFAVKTLIGWYRDGLDVAARMPLLSTYMGHADPARTYWYLSAAPELLALAAGRLEPDREELA
jgi:integrase/recombinase XerD